MNLHFSGLAPQTNVSSVKFSGDDPMPSSIDYEKSGKKSSNKYNDDSDTFIPGLNPKKAKKQKFEEGVTKKQKAKYYTKKTGYGLAAATFLGLLGWAGYDSAVAFSPDTQVQEAYEEVKEETQEMRETEGQGEETLHLQHYFGEIYNNLYLNGDIDLEQLTEINQQLENLDNSNLTEAQKTQLNVLIEASEDIDNVDEMKALNETFLDIYIQDADQREALLTASNEMLDQGYLDSVDRSTSSKVWNPLLVVLNIFNVSYYSSQMSKVKKPKPEDA